MIKQIARELEETFSDRYPRDAVNQYTQFSLGVLALAGETFGDDPFPIVRASANLAAQNVRPDGWNALAEGMQRDEELSAAILEANSRLAGGGPEAIK